MAPRWDQAPGVPRISAGGKRFQQSDQTSATTDVGPGTYSVPTTMGPKKSVNRRPDVMLTAAPRFHERSSTNVPGPGHYDTQMLYGNMLKQTYNVAIAEASADIY